MSVHEQMVEVLRQYRNGDITFTFMLAGLVQIGVELEEAAADDGMCAHCSRSKAVPAVEAPKLMWIIFQANNGGYGVGLWSGARYAQVGDWMGSLAAAKAFIDSRDL